MLFLPTASNLTALARRFGLFKSCFFRQRPIFQHWLTRLDFSSLVSALYVHSTRSGLPVWTFQVPFLPVTSILLALACQFGPFKSHSCRQRPIFQLRRVILDLSSSLPASNVQSPSKSNQFTTTYIRN